MQFRGWVLYVFVNEILIKKIIMELVPLSAMATMVDSSQQQQLLQGCWYSNQQSDIHNLNVECYGRQFDFSDHIVLFFAHYYPIMIVEAIIICSIHPLWSLSTQHQKHHHENTKVETIQQSTFVNFLFNKISPVILLLFVAYLSCIVLASVYSTAAYFHTIPESIIGYLLSLSVQIPIGFILLYQGGFRIRNFVGLTIDNDGVHHVD